MRILIFAMLMLCSGVSKSATLTSNSPCSLNAGQSQCTVTLNWNISEAPIACLWLNTGSLFACGGQSGSVQWPFTPLAGTTFILRGHQSWDNITVSAPQLKTLTAYAIVPPLVIPATYGTIDNYLLVNGGDYRITFGFGPPNSNSLYPASTYYFVRRLPGVVERFHNYWPYGQEPTLNIANTRAEETSFKYNCKDGSSWYWLDRYVNYQSTYVDIANIKTLKALYTHGGKTWDITSVCGVGVPGQPYSPKNVPSGGFRVQVWGYLYPGTINKPFYWDWYAERIPSSTNSHWVGTGATTRPALRNDEWWWSNGDSWTGQMGPLTQAPGTGNWPTGLAADGVSPMPRNPEKGFIGQNAGHFWNSAGNGSITRSRNVEPYTGPWPNPNP